MAIFVAPVWKESFGQVAPMAMNFGLPVAGYDVGALSEILGSAETLAPVGDSQRLAAIILDLLENRRRREKLGARNRTRAQTLFSMESMVAAYRQLYRELLEPA